jgi:hypothetical protein
MSDRNVLEPGYCRAYDWGEDPLCGLSLPGAREVRTDLAAIWGPGECLESKGWPDVAPWPELLSPRDHG